MPEISVCGKLKTVKLKNSFISEGFYILFIILNSYVIYSLVSAYYTNGLPTLDLMINKHNIMETMGTEI